MSRLYRMLSLIDVDAVLPENEQDFWKDVLYPFHEGRV